MNDDRDFIDAAAYGLIHGEDAVPALRRALQACGERGARRLIVPPGTYRMRPDLGVEKYLFTSNNDSGLKRIGILIEGVDGFELDASGALFMCEGPMVPICVIDSRDVTVRNFRVDWERPFYFQGTVVDVDPDAQTVDLAVLEECHYTIRDHQLVFRGRPEPAQGGAKLGAAPLVEDLTWEQDARWSMWFDQAGRPVSRQTLPRYAIAAWPRAEEVRPGVVRMSEAFPTLPEPGMALILKGTKEPNRASPAIVLTSSKDVMIEDATLHHAGGMGLIGHRCENVTLRRFDVRLPAQGARRCTTSADATHFTLCRGLIQLEDCHLENMLDDGTNVHGTFVRVERQLDDRTVLCRFMHSQQVGLIFAEPGDRIRLCTDADLQAFADADVVAVRDYNSERFVLTLANPLGEELRAGTVAMNQTWQPALEVRRCTVLNNKARSILVQTAGPVVIEDNHFEGASAAGVQFIGDARFWYEAGPVADVTIRNNTFAEIRGPIVAVAPTVDTELNPAARYHRNIRVEGNLVGMADPRLIEAHAVEGLVFEGNTLRAVHDLPEGDAFVLTASSGVVIGDNTVELDRGLTVRADALTDVSEPPSVDARGERSGL